MVGEPAVYSKLFWHGKYCKSDSDTHVLIVVSFSAVFAFNAFAVIFPVLQVESSFSKIFLSTLTRTELQLCTVRDADL